MSMKMLLTVRTGIVIRIMTDDFASLTQRPVSVLIQSTLRDETRFLISHLLKEHLVSGARCVFVTVDHNTVHYENILKKLGVVIQTFILSGQLLILDVLTMLNNDDLPTGFICTFHLIFEEIVGTLRSWLTEKDSRDDFVLIIDSISTLLCLNAHPEQLLSFCRCCMNIGRMVLGQPSSFITLCASDVDPEAIANIRPLFDWIIDPIPMNLLSMANVDGRLYLKKQKIASGLSPDAEMEFSAKCYYRLRETGVVFLPHVDLDL